ncbi:hypothetical protein AGMMS50262_01780 [Bacteroidia bacterium]|nr:hypothetical protein AGMMS50262_01780 [Bacteroidia bacterium]
MGENNFNDIIVDYVLKNTPDNVMPVSSIMEILGLSKETAYRRLRQEIPFTFDEVSKLALALHFSIDELIEGSKKETFSFDLQSKIVSPAANAYFSQFQEYNNYLEKLVTAKHAEILITLNEFPPVFFVLSDQLFKFCYFQWLHSHSEKPVLYSFSDLTLNPQLLALKEEILTNITKMDNVSVIMSSYVYLRTIKSIQYYYQCKLITADELLLLKQDMLDFINLLAKLAKTGYVNDETKVGIDIYLSPLNINSNILYLEYDKMRETHFWIYPMNPFIIRNPEICSIQKKWCQSLKKQSMFITLSGEIFQAEFNEKQRVYAETYLSTDAKFTYVY